MGDRVSVISDCGKPVSQNICLRGMQTLNTQSSEYSRIKRPLSNLTRELQGLGSKQLSTNERLRYLNRYRNIKNKIGVENKRLSDREKKKVRRLIIEFEQRFQHCGFIEMEPSTATSEPKAPDTYEENEAYNLRSTASNLKTSEVSNPDYSNFQTCIQHWWERLTDLDSSHADLGPQLDSLVKDIKQNPNLSQFQMKGLLNSCAELEKNLEIANAKENEKQSIFQKNKPNVSNDRYFAIKTQIENLSAHFKSMDLSDMNNLWQQFYRVVDSIETHQTELHPVEANDLFEMCSEFKKKVKEKEQIEHSTTTCIQQTNSENVKTYGSWCPPSSGSKKVNSNQIESMIDSERRNKCDLNTTTIKSKYNQETNHQEYQHTNRPLPDIPKTHSYCKTEHVHKRGSDTSTNLRLCKGMTFNKQQSKCEEGMEYDASGLPDVQNKQTEDRRTLIVQEEDKVPNFHSISPYGKSTDARIIHMDREESSRTTIGVSNQQKYCPQQIDEHVCSGVDQRTKEVSTGRKSAAERLKDSLPQNKQVTGREPMYTEGQKSSGYDKKDTKYVDSTMNSESRRSGMRYHEDRFENKEVVLDDNTLVDPHYHNNISSNQNPRLQDRGDYNYQSKCYQEQNAENKGPEGSLNVERSSTFENDAERYNKRIYGHSGTRHSPVQFSTGMSQSHHCHENRSSQTNQKLREDNRNRHNVLERAKEAKEEPLQILDVHQYFRDDFDLNSVDSLNLEERIDTIDKYAKTFDSKVSSFEEEKYSLEYFILDEKLMRLIEKLDKIKCQDNPGLTNKKIEVIEYIKKLHSVLDQRAKE